ncbi:HNH endonuclease domain-containing protein [Metabacillus bambusae]|uniref:HNH endonuclease domain-containing protein n=1 Tax=Metabacillus bambusae TaxID=2795218 RepID=UPI001FB0AA32|nr:HNH endonuclease domain-containing protein [Metabacillus bambusae]
MVFDKVDDTLQIRLVSKVKTTMKENVYGALYGDTRGSFYAFDHKKEIVKLNPVVHSFMLNYQRLIVNLTNYHMAAMIEQLNEVPSINYLLGKVESIAKRSSLKPFEKILLTYFKAECFYCSKKLSDNERETHVDHFIPWSFVQSDNIWNLVLSCNKCNSSKSDRLPTRGYLEDIIERNHKLSDENEDATIITLMKNYKSKKIIMLYDFSIKNGFDSIWVPKY